MTVLAALLASVPGVAKLYHAKVAARSPQQGGEQSAKVPPKIEPRGGKAEGPAEYGVLELPPELVPAAAARTAPVTTTATNVHALSLATLPFPTPLTPVAPLGSLVYEGSVAGTIALAGDTCDYTLAIDAGQTISLLVTPSVAGLQPRIELLDPNNASLGFAVAPAASQVTGIQTRAVTLTGTHTFRVTGSGGTTGGFTLRALLNAAFELEGPVVGAANNTRATAQNIDGAGGAFVTLQTSLSSASRAAVLGGDPLALTPVQTFDFESGQQGFVINNGPVAGHVAGLWHLSAGRGAQAGHSPVTSFYFGAGEGPGGGGNYNVGNTAGSITSAPILLPNVAGLALRFNYVLQTEGNGSFDVASVQVSNNGGVTFTTLLSSTSAAQLPLSSVWANRTANLSAFAGQTVLIRFNFDTIDSIVNNFEGWYVDDVQILAGATWNDYYSFTAAASTMVTAALRQLSGTSANVFLEDAGGAVLATGAASATNYDSGISNFLIPAAGTYFLRVSGSAAATYNVVLTRDAAFDPEANSTFAAAQPLAGNKGALGHVRAGNAVLDFESGQQGFTTNNNVIGTGASAGLWHLSTRRGAEAGHSAVTSFYYGDEAGGTYNTGARNAGTITSAPVLIQPGDSLSFNYVLQTEGNGSFDVASVQVSTNNFATSTTILTSTSAASLPLRATWGTASASLAAFVGQTVQVRFSFDTVDSIVNAFEGWYVDDVLIGVGVDEDWYSVNVAAGQSVLLATSTPSDGPGEFANTLNPRIELYSPANVLLASGAALADGRNEALVASGLAAGVYRIRVTGEGTTNGEYFLSAGSCPTITLPASLPAGVQGLAYNQSVAANPAGSYSYAVTTNVLPPGLALNSATGALTGTPTAAGNYTFVITATGFGGCAGSQAYNLLITATCGTVTVNPASLPGGTLGTPYSQTVTASPAGTYTFSLVSGALPAGLTLNASTGVISGTPTAAGTFTPTIRATDAGGCTGQRLYVLSITCGTVTVSPTSLPNGTLGVAYSQTVTASPSAAYTYTVFLGSLPPGFNLNGTTGVLSGVSTATGAYTFTIRAALGNCSGTRQYTISINNPPSVAPLDFDGDRRSELVRWWPEDGALVWEITRSSDEVTQREVFGAATATPVAADYDGDSKADLAVFDAGVWLIRLSASGKTRTESFGAPGDVPVPGDYDGDGKRDLAVYRAGLWLIARSSDGATQSFGLGEAGSVPVPADYDGDGRTDLAVFQAGFWLVQLSAEGRQYGLPLGRKGDVPLAADFDGDGQAEMAVWRASEGALYVGNEPAQAFARLGRVPFTDLILLGDYDGDGRAELAVRQADGAAWQIVSQRVNEH